MMRPSSYFNCDMRPFSRHCRLPHAHPGAWWGRRNTTQNTTMATCRVMQVGCCQGRMAKEEATINVASAAFTSPSPSSRWVFRRGLTSQWGCSTLDQEFRFFFEIRRSCNLNLDIKAAPIRIPPSTCTSRCQSALTSMTLRLLLRLLLVFGLQHTRIAILLCDVNCRLVFCRLRSSAMCD